MTEAAVVDASVALEWVVPEVDSDLALRIRQARMYAPELPLLECANALRTKTRRGEISRRDASECLDRLSRAPIVLVPDLELAEATLILALTIDHAIDDCTHLALARQRGLSLVTSDQRFHRTIQDHPDLRDHVTLLQSLA